MGKISQGILGGVSGKVGNVVGASWKGINYIRIMPASVANPKTEGQVNQRTKFSAVLAFCQTVRSFVRIGYKFQQDKKSAFNAAMSYLLRNAITGSAPNFTVDYANALVSRGKLLSPAGADVSELDGIATVTWTDNSGEANGQGTDKALLLVYNAAKKDALIALETGITRADASATLSIPGTYSEDTVQVYLAFLSADGTEISNSVHVGALVIG